MAGSSYNNARQPIVKPRSQVNEKQVPQYPAVTTAMPSSRGDRPKRSAKQVHLKPGYVDSSTLLFDSDDEGIDDAKSKDDHDSEDKGKSEDDDEDRHIVKKPRLGGKPKAQAKKKVSPPPPDSSCLAYYPGTHAAVQKWNKMLGLPPPHPMSEASTNKMPEREVDSPEAQVAKTVATYGFGALDAVPPGFRLVPSNAIKKNSSYDETKAGFEKLPGEIRNKIYALVFEKEAPIDFTNRSGFAHSAAFLRVNKVVYNEARAFIYGGNRFVFGYNHSKSGGYFEPVWNELGWTHVRRFLTDIGPKNISLIQTVGVFFYDASQSGNPGTTTNQRRYTYDKDLLWILDHLSQHGKILKLKLGFCGRRKVRMSTRDKDFLNALKGVKTDKLEIGNPTCDGEGKFDRHTHDRLDELVEELLSDVMVRPLPLKDLDPRLEF